MDKTTQQIKGKTMRAETKPPGEREYDFVLVLNGNIDLTTDVEDALFEAGCDDATIGVQGGRIYLGFTRSAPSFDDAPLWSWCEVAHWLWQNRIVKEDVVRAAHDTELINSILAFMRQHELHPAHFIGGRELARVRSDDRRLGRLALLARTRPLDDFTPWTCPNCCANVPPQGLQIHPFRYHLWFRSSLHQSRSVLVL